MGTVVLQYRHGSVWKGMGVLTMACCGVAVGRAEEGSVHRWEHSPLLSSVHLLVLAVPLKGRSRDIVAAAGSSPGPAWRAVSRDTPLAWLRLPFDPAAPAPAPGPPPPAGALCAASSVHGAAVPREVPGPHHARREQLPISCQLPWLPLTLRTPT